MPRLPVHYLGALTALVLPSAAMAQIVRQTAPIGPIRPTVPVTPDRLQTPNLRQGINVTGPMTLSVIDPGYSPGATGNTRELSFTACVADASGNPGTVSSFHYTLKLNGMTKEGEMDMPVLQPPQTPTYKNGGTFRVGSAMTGCRRARIEFTACQVPPGEYDLQIRADGLTADEKAVFAPNEASVYVAYVPNTEIGTPVAINGNVSAPCSARPQSVSLFADGGEVVEAPVGANGQFSAPYVFRRAGSARLRAYAEGTKDYTSAAAFADLTVAKVPMNATVASLPDAVKIGGTIPVVAQLRSAKSNLPIAGMPVTFHIGGATDCTANTQEDGRVQCTLAVSVNDAAIGTSRTIELKVADASNLSVSGAEKVVFTSAEGLIVRKVSGDFLMPMLAGAQPYGVLLNSYNPKWTGTGAHLDNGSRLYPTSDLTKFQAFDIKTVHVSDDVVFYLNNILIRFKPFVLSAPARINASLYITGMDGRGPSVKGFCFDSFCTFPGYDDFIPDVTNIALTSGDLAVDVNVVDGKIKPTLASVDASISFTCGGLAGPACGLLHPYVNSQLNAQLKKPGMIDAMLERVGQTMDAQLAPWRKTWLIDKLVSLSWDDQGNLTVTGTPLPQ